MSKNARLGKKHKLKQGQNVEREKCQKKGHKSRQNAEREEDKKLGGVKMWNKRENK